MQNSVESEPKSLTKKVDEKVLKVLHSQCAVCDHFRRKVKEIQKTISYRDILIEMLQNQLKKFEGLYKNSLDDTEKLRMQYCMTLQELSNFKEICKQLEQEHVKYINLKRKTNYIDDKHATNRKIRLIQKYSNEETKKKEEICDQSLYDLQSLPSTHTDSVSSIIRETEGILEQRPIESVGMNQEIMKNNYIDAIKQNGQLIIKLKKSEIKVEELMQENERLKKHIQFLESENKSYELEITDLSTKLFNISATSGSGEDGRELVKYKFNVDSLQEPLPDKVFCRFQTYTALTSDGTNAKKLENQLLTKINPELEELCDCHDVNIKRLKRELETEHSKQIELIASLKDNVEELNPSDMEKNAVVKEELNKLLIRNDKYQDLIQKLIDEAVALKIEQEIEINELEEEVTYMKKLTDEKYKVRENNNRLQIENASLKKTIADMKHDAIKPSAVDVPHKTTHHVNYEKQIEMYVNEIKDLNNKYETHIAELQLEIDNLRFKDNTKHTSTISDENLKKRDKIVEESKKKINELKTEILKLEESNKQERNKHEEKIRKLENSNKGEQNKYEDKIRSMDEQISQLKKRNAEYELGTINNAKHATDEKFKMQENNNRLQIENASLKKTIADMKHDSMKTSSVDEPKKTARHVNYENQIEDLTNKYETQIAELQIEIDDLRVKDNATNSQDNLKKRGKPVAESQKRINELQTEILKLEESSKQERNQHEEKIRKLENSRKVEENKYEDKIRSMAEDISQLRERNAEYERGTMKNTKYATEEKYKMQEENNNRLQIENASLKKTIADMKHDSMKASSAGEPHKTVPQINYENQIEMYVNEIKDLTNKYETQIAELQIEIDDLKVKDNTTHTSTISHDNLKKRGKPVAESQKKINELQTEILKLKESGKQERNQYEEKIRKLENSCKVEQNKYEDKLRSMAEQISQSKERNAEYELGTINKTEYAPDEKYKMQENINRLQIENASLKKTIADMKHDSIKTSSAGEPHKTTPQVNYENQIEIYVNEIKDLTNKYEKQIAELQLEIDDLTAKDNTTHTSTISHGNQKKRGKPVAESQKRINELQIEILKLKESSKQERNQYEEKIRKLQDSSKVEQNKYEDKLKSMAEQISQLTNRNSEYELETMNNTEYATEIQKLISEKSNLEATIAKLQSDNDELKQGFSEITKRSKLDLENLENQNLRRITSFEKQIKTSGDEIQKLKKQNVELESEIRQTVEKPFTEKINKLENKKSELEKQIAQLDKYKQELDIEYASKIDQITIITEEKSKLEENVNQLQKENGELKQEISEMKNQVKTEYIEIQNVINEKSKLEEVVNTLQNETDDLKRFISNMKIKTDYTKIEKLTEEKRRFETDAINLQNENDDLKKTLVDLKNQNEKDKTKIEKLSEENSKLKQKILDLQRKNDDLNETATQIKYQTKTDMLNLQNRHSIKATTYERQIKTYENEIQDLQKHVASLQLELSNMLSKEKSEKTLSVSYEGTIQTSSRKQIIVPESNREETVNKLKEKIRSLKYNMSELELFAEQQHNEYEQKVNLLKEKIFELEKFTKDAELKEKSNGIEIQKLQDEKCILRENILKLQNDNNILKQKISEIKIQVRTDIENLEHKIMCDAKLYKKKIDKYENDINDVNTKYQKLIIELQSEMNYLKSKAEAEKTSMEKTSHKFQERIGQLENEVRTLEEKTETVNKLKQQLVQLETLNNDLNKHLIDEKNKNIANQNNLRIINELETQIENADQKYEILSNEHKSVKEALNKILHENGNIRLQACTKHEVGDTYLKTIKEENELLKEQLRQFLNKETSKELMSKLCACNEGSTLNRSEYQKILDELKQELYRLDRNLKLSEAEVAKLSETNKKLMEIIQVQFYKDDDIETSDSATDKCKDHCLKKQIIIKSLEQSVDRGNRTLKDCLEELEKLKTDNELLKRECEKVKAIKIGTTPIGIVPNNLETHEVCKAFSKDYEGKIALLKNENQTLKAQYKALKALYDDLQTVISDSIKNTTNKVLMDQSTLVKPEDFLKEKISRGNKTIYKKLMGKDDIQSLVSSNEVVLTLYKSFSDSFDTQESLMSGDQLIYERINDKNRGNRKHTIFEKHESMDEDQTEDIKDKALLKNKKDVLKKKQSLKADGKLIYEDSNDKNQLNIVDIFPKKGLLKKEEDSGLQNMKDKKRLRKKRYSLDEKESLSEDDIHNKNRSINQRNDFERNRSLRDRSQVMSYDMNDKSRLSKANTIDIKLSIMKEDQTTDDNAKNKNSLTEQRDTIEKKESLLNDNRFSFQSKEMEIPTRSCRSSTCLDDIRDLRVAVEELRKHKELIESEFTLAKSTLPIPNEKFKESTRQHSKNYFQSTDEVQTTENEKLKIELELKEAEFKIIQEKYINESKTVNQLKENIDYICKENENLKTTISEFIGNFQSALKSNDPKGLVTLQKFVEDNATDLTTDIDQTISNDSRRFSKSQSTLTCQCDQRISTTETSGTPQDFKIKVRISANDEVLGSYESAKTCCVTSCKKPSSLKSQTYLRKLKQLRQEIIDDKRKLSKNKSSCYQGDLCLAEIERQIKLAEDIKQETAILRKGVSAKHESRSISRQKSEGKSKSLDGEPSYISKSFSGEIKEKRKTPQHTSKDISFKQRQQIIKAYDTPTKSGSPLRKQKNMSSGTPTKSESSLGKQMGSMSIDSLRTKLTSLQKSTSMDGSLKKSTSSLSRDSKMSVDRTSKKISSPLGKAIKISDDSIFKKPTSALGRETKVSVGSPRKKSRSPLQKPRKLSEDGTLRKSTSALDKETKISVDSAYQKSKSPLRKPIKISDNSTFKKPTSALGRETKVSVGSPRKKSRSPLQNPRKLSGDGTLRKSTSALDKETKISVDSAYQKSKSPLRKPTKKLDDTIKKSTSLSRETKKSVDSTRQKSRSPARNPRKMLDDSHRKSTPLCRQIKTSVDSTRTSPLSREKTLLEDNTIKPSSSSIRKRKKMLPKQKRSKILQKINKGLAEDKENILKEMELLDKTKYKKHVKIIGGIKRQAKELPKKTGNISSESRESEIRSWEKTTMRSREALLKKHHCHLEEDTPPKTGNISSESRESGIRSWEKTTMRSREALLKKHHCHQEDDTPNSIPRKANQSRNRKNKPRSAKTTSSSEENN